MIKNNRFYLVLIISSLFLSACSLPFISEKKAGLSVTASPNAGVFLNGNHVGSTPYYDEKVKAGEYTIKIVPEGGIGLPWESNISLMPGIMTVISRQLGQTEETSSGYFLTLNPNGSKDKTNIEVVTLPDKSVVNIDGESRGFSPISLDNITPGEHVLLITAPGYIDRSINANLRIGHTLKASVQLARSEITDNTETDIVDDAENNEPNSSEDEILDEKTTPTAKPTVKPTAKSTAKPKPTINLDPPYITVLQTDTGYLNVREEPSTKSDILVKIKPGESYPFVEKNNTGWYKIEYLQGEEGWISGKYVKLVQ